MQYDIKTICGLFGFLISDDQAVKQIPQYLPAGN